MTRRKKLPPYISTGRTHVIYEVDRIKKTEFMTLIKKRPTPGGVSEYWSCGICLSYCVSLDTYRYISIDCIDHREMIPEVKRLLEEKNWSPQDFINRLEYPETSSEDYTQATGATRTKRATGTPRKKRTGNTDSPTGLDHSALDRSSPHRGSKEESKPQSVGSRKWVTRNGIRRLE
jgi:hypothetical protein